MPDLAELMKQVSDGWSHVFVRYDPERESKMFTVMMDRKRLGDTDDPAAVLQEVLNERERHANQHQGEDESSV